MNLESIVIANLNFQALSFAIVTVAMSMFAQFPAPLIYGHLFDASCAEFRNVCGRIGDCLHYDNDLFRFVSRLSLFNDFLCFFNRRDFSNILI